MRGNIQIGAISERRIDAGLKIVVFFFKKKMKLFLNPTYCMVTSGNLPPKKKNKFIYCASASVRHSTCRKDPNSTESTEEAALKASGPMPCALLIVTRAFLPSNSDW